MTPIPPRMGYLLIVRALDDLPIALPDPIALKNCGQNSSAYEPWFWETEYLSQRYLERVPVADVQARHSELIKNLRRKSSRSRDSIPIRFEQSSWYWYRKEHQTRLELHMRHVQPACNANAKPKAGNINGRFPTNELGDPKLLFRYTRQNHAEETRNRGLIRVAPAMAYRDIEGDVARADDEMVKTVILPGGSTRISDKDGNEIRVIGDAQIHHSGPDYFVSCFSTAWDPLMFDDFRCGYEVHGFRSMA